MNVVKKWIYSYFIPIIGKIVLQHNDIPQVIYYHDVTRLAGKTYDSINFNNFKKEMFWVKQKLEPCNFSDITNVGGSTKKRVLITFDDGWKSNYELIFKFMQKNRIKYNIFIETERIDNGDKRYLNWDQVNIMNKSGFVEFGSHTHNHIHMLSANKVEIEKQIQISNNLIQKHTGSLPQDFCFPFGEYNRRVMKLVLLIPEYKRIYTSDSKPSYYLNNKMVFGRIAISNDDDMKMFINKVKGYYNCLFLFFKIKNIIYYLLKK
jgi:peptidoglycan/xylan/chitin deacetylase (PgdA/CDA1 family)